MTVTDDLKVMITKRLLPAGFIRNYQRVIGLALFIEELIILFRQLMEKSLDEEVEKREMTIAECSELMEKFLNTSKSFDTKIIQYMIGISKASDDVIRAMTVALHYRNDKDYDRIVADELEKKELPHHVWLEILNHKEPWFLRVSSKIERVVLTKTFETSPNSSIIIAICKSYIEKSCNSKNTMMASLSSSNLPVGVWNELSEYFSISSVNDMPYPFDVSRFSVEKLSEIRRTFSEIKKLADEKIKQLREKQNHQLTI